MQISLHRPSLVTACLLRKGIDRTHAVLAGAAIPFPVSAASGKLLPPTSIGGGAGTEGRAMIDRWNSIGLLGDNNAVTTLMHRHWQYQGKCSRTINLLLPSWNTISGRLW